MLRCIQRKETDPYFNIAAEEYLLQHATTDTFMIWTNSPCVVIGKHQNAAREINHTMIHENGIPVIRRITGGGTVYHDTGNINFSFIRLNRKENPVDFKFFTAPIILFLKNMGLDAEFEGKSNISVNGMKISGNSAHVHKGRVLHHGTLLFDSDLNVLDEIISSSEDRYEDRSVRSVRRKVSNIAQHIRADMAVEDFKDSFFSFIINFYDDAYHDNLTAAEISGIGILAREKYMDPKWNFGYSPDYQYVYEWTAEEGEFVLSLTTKEAVIHSIRIQGPQKFKVLLTESEKLLTGTLHERDSVIQALHQLNLASIKEKKVINQIIDHLF